MGPVSRSYHRAETFRAANAAQLAVGSSAQADWTTDGQAWNSLVTALACEALGHQEGCMTAEQLQHALTSRIVIEQAKGVIAAREGVTVDEAFARLREYARRQRADIHDVARTVVELGLLV